MFELLPVAAGIVSQEHSFLPCAAFCQGVYQSNRNEMKTLNMEEMLKDEVEIGLNFCFPALRSSSCSFTPHFLIDSQKKDHLRDLLFLQRICLKEHTPYILLSSKVDRCQWLRHNWVTITSGSDSGLCPWIVVAAFQGPWGWVAGDVITNLSRMLGRIEMICHRAVSMAVVTEPWKVLHNELLVH